MDCVTAAEGFPDRDAIIKDFRDLLEKDIIKHGEPYGISALNPVTIQKKKKKKKKKKNRINRSCVFWIMDFKTYSSCCRIDPTFT